MIVTPAECRLIIRNACQGIELWSTAAEDLLLGTAAHESEGFKFVHQVGGPALGLWQEEPASHDDTWSNYLAFRPQISKKIADFLPGVQFVAATLQTDHTYAAIMARIKYERVPAPLPPADDLAAYAAYWKQWYNTPQGKGTEQEFINDWDRYVKPEAAGAASA